MRSTLRKSSQREQFICLSVDFFRVAPPSGVYSSTRAVNLLNCPFPELFIYLDCNFSGAIRGLSSLH
jgi:hypothetical protein